MQINQNNEKPTASNPKMPEAVWEGRQTTMAHYLMSDIHGEADRFHAMLEMIGFSEDDVLIIIGDVIDRGPVICTPQVSNFWGAYQSGVLFLFGETGPTDLKI